MKEVRVCEAMKSPVETSSDGTVLHQQDGGTKSRQVPIWEKSNLTLEEAAAYSGIGINKLREITNEDKCKFVLWVGNKRLIKRRLFDCFIEQAYSSLESCNVFSILYWWKSHGRYGILKLTPICAFHRKEFLNV